MLDDYTLHLIKRAYLTKRAAGVNAPKAYDPIEVYDDALQQEKDKVRYSDANKLRLRKEYSKRYAISDAIQNGLLGLGAGGLLGYTAGKYGPMLPFVGSNMQSWGTVRPGLIGSLALGTIGGIGGYLKGKKRGYALGEEEGTKLDNEAYNKAVEKAIQQFNLAQTGTLHPSKFQKYKRGIQLYDQI